MAREGLAVGAHVLRDGPEVLDGADHGDQDAKGHQGDVNHPLPPRDLAGGGISKMRGEWGLVSFGGGWVAPDNLCETAARAGSPSSPPCGGFSLQGGEGWGQLLLVSEFPHAGLAAPPRSLTVEEDGEDEVEGRDEEASHQRGELLEERDSVGDHEAQHDDRRGAPEPLELAPPPKVVDVPRGDPHVDHPGEEEKKRCRQR